MNPHKTGVDTCRVHVFVKTLLRRSWTTASQTFERMYSSKASKDPNHKATHCLVAGVLTQTKPWEPQPSFMFIVFVITHIFGVLKTFIFPWVLGSKGQVITWYVHLDSSKKFLLSHLITDMRHPWLPQYQWLPLATYRCWIWFSKLWQCCSTEDRVKGVRLFDLLWRRTILSTTINDRLVGRNMMEVKVCVPQNHGGYWWNSMGLAWCVLLITFLERKVTDKSANQLFLPTVWNDS